MGSNRPDATPIGGSPLSSSENPMISLPSLTSKRITTARIATTEPAFQVLQSNFGRERLVAVVITGRFSFPDLHAAVDNESTERVAKGVSSNCPIKTGSGGDECGRSSTAGRRVGGERTPAFQAQGSVGKHHWRSEASLLLPEAGREAPSEASFGAKACPKKVSQRLRVSCNH